MSTRRYPVPLLSAVVLMGACIVSPAEGGFSSGGPTQASSWQRRLDKALLDVDATPQVRVRNFQRAVQDPDLPVDVSIAVRAIRKYGFGKGHPEAINTLWPVGTTARSDLEGLSSLTKQVPEALAELRERVPDLIGSARDRPSTFRGKITLDTLPKLDEIDEELKNALRSTPKGLEAPKYAVVRTIQGEMKLGVPEKIEIRQYDAFKVASTPSISGTGFNTLASYLFGANEEKRVMSMTMPVLIDRGSDEEGNMKFVLPSSVEDAPPTPLKGEDVKIEQVSERLVAIKSFPGLATQEEISRQKESLLSALKEAGVSVLNKDEVSLLQYNSPLTLPWRRRNELALIVEVDEADSGTVDDNELERWRSRQSVTSWYDAGVRL